MARWALSVGLLAAVAASPHVVHIVVDDWSWGYRPSSPDDANGNPESQTPYLDNLSAHGLTLQRFYAHKICSPSRFDAASFNLERLSPTVVHISPNQHFKASIVFFLFVAIDLVILCCSGGPTVQIVASFRP